MSGKSKWVAAVALAMAAFGVTACEAQHGQPHEEVAVGEKAPEWNNLPGVDGNEHSLADLEARLVAVVFSCHHCPVYVAYEERLNQLQADYDKEDVLVVALNPNNIWGEDTLDHMKARAEELEYNFLYVHDASQDSGHQYGARVTPHVFLLDDERVVRYIGAIDDSQNPANVQTTFLRDAIDALLAGEDPPLAETKAFGCTVKYE